MAILRMGLDDALLTQGTSLDRFYIPIRYPNGVPAGAPHDYFSQDDAVTAIAADEVTAPRF